jgi:FtsH-binding integral membrane protein
LQSLFTGIILPLAHTNGGRFMRYVNIYSSWTSETADEGLRLFMRCTYKNMGISLLLSSLVAFVVGHSPVLLQMILANRFMALLITLAPFFLLISFQKALQFPTVAEARQRLYTLAGLMGLSMATVFLAYTDQQITTVFLTTAVSFGAMSLYGYVTNRNLANWNSFLLMGSVGLLLAMIFNIFQKSSTFDYVLSCGGVLLFVVYTAFDVNNLKNLYLSQKGYGDTITIEKIAVLGALRLYLDFINLFSYLLRLTGDRQRD